MIGLLAALVGLFDRVLDGGVVVVVGLDDEFVLFLDLDVAVVNGVVERAAVEGLGLEVEVGLKLVAVLEDQELGVVPVDRGDTGVVGDFGGLRGGGGIGTGGLGRRGIGRAGVRISAGDEELRAEREEQHQCGDEYGFAVAVCFSGFHVFRFPFRKTLIFQIVGYGSPARDARETFSSI